MKKKTVVFETLDPIHRASHRRGAVEFASDWLFHGKKGENGLSNKQTVHFVAL